MSVFCLTWFKNIEANITNYTHFDFILRSSKMREV